MTRATGNLTRADIASAIQRDVGLTYGKSVELVEAILAHMCASMSAGENVKISGFGTFLLRDKGERIGRNPKTGEEHAIAPRRVLTFRASAKLRSRVVQAPQAMSSRAGVRELVTQD
ncbi:integration host factor subunit alpha [Pseudomonas sp.]|uniref:integration host factor subunit alpha n=1 Tax=Pseudomonas sp. TaxID=306 RepID=UPI003D0D62D3